MKYSAIILLSLVGLLSACGSGTPSETTAEPADENAFKAAPEGAVSFLNIQDGDTLQSPFKVEFGVEGMGVVPAGDMSEGTGHHHLIINGSFIREGVVVPADEKHIHFGMGQTETEVTLEPGNYMLTMQFADGMHRSYGREYSDRVSIVVVD